MDSSERAMLIRRGNELFNNGDTKNALKIYIATSYKDGIARVASHFERKNNDPVSALKLYKKAGMQGNVEKIAYSMAQTIRKLLEEDKVLLSQANGSPYNSGSKLSGQAPSMLPSEALRLAREKMGLPPEAALSPAEKDGRIRPWRPVTISRNQLEGEE